MRHFLSLLDFSKDEILEILQLSKQIKDETKKRVFKEYMPKKVLGMILKKALQELEYLLKLVYIN